MKRKRTQMEENINFGILLRDFIIYCKDNHLDQTIIKNINQWNIVTSKKAELKVILSTVLKKNFYKILQEELRKIYTLLINEMNPAIIKLKDRIYSNFELIQSDITSTVYECIMKDKKDSIQIIVKAYPIIFYSESEENEFNVLKSLNDKQLCIPKLYPTFKSEHFNCYPMEKIQISLVDLLKQKEKEDIKGLTLIQLKMMLKSIVPILQYLHQELNYLYVDFSPRNIGINNIEHNNCIFYMFDFGEVEKFSSDTRPVRFTDRYASIKAMDFENISIYDDFESLGFLLLDSHYGVYDSPLGINPSIESKKELLIQLRNRDKENFFTNYFTAILDVKNVYKKISKLYESLGKESIHSPILDDIAVKFYNKKLKGEKMEKKEEKVDKKIKPVMEKEVKPVVPRKRGRPSTIKKILPDKIIPSKAKKTPRRVVSRKITVAKPKKSTVSNGKIAPSQREKELKKLTVVKLKYRLKKNKLSTVGRKDDLIKRLIEFEN